MSFFQEWLFFKKWFDDHLQEVSPSGSSFARGRPLQMTICKRPVSSDHQEAGSSFWQQQKGHEKWLFETLHNEIECVLSVKGSISMKKRIKMFTFAYGQGRGGWPPSPYGQPDRKISFFIWLPLNENIFHLINCITIKPKNSFLGLLLLVSSSWSNWMKNEIDSTWEVKF